MRRRVGLAALVVASLIAMAVGWCAGRAIPFVEQVTLLRELREVSTIVFGIMGAWSAIVYPDELKRRLRPSELLAVDGDAIERFGTLTRCVVWSAAIVGAILIMEFAAPIVGQIPWVHKHHLHFRSASFAVGCLLMIVQIWVVLLMLVPINAADADARMAREAQQRINSGSQGIKGVPKD